MIEVLASGPLTTFQDRGRSGLRRLGVPRAGALAPHWMAVANALVGNATDAVVLECFEGGLRLAVRERPVRFAHVGGAEVVLTRSGRRHALRAWRSHMLSIGDELVVRGTGTARLAVLAVRALAVPPVLGSASTYARAGLGGLDGRAVAAGDRLPIDERDDGTDENGLSGPDLGCSPFVPAVPSDASPVRLRAVAGPQADAFDETVLTAFFDTLWTLSTEVDRMGARLDGPPIRHRDAAARDIVSDAIVPGSVQVPGSGLPIVMLADAHTAGGYPKIATVVSSDLDRLAVQRPGTRFRLERLDVEAAVRSARDGARALERHLASIAPLAPDAIDTARLFAHNLVDGVTDGADEMPAGPPGDPRTTRGST